MVSINRGYSLVVVGAIALSIIGWAVWTRLEPKGMGEGFVNGNGRIEATEIDIATKLGGRVQDILVKEGDFVLAGQLLVRIQSDSLIAQQAEAAAQARRAVTAVASAKAQVAARKSDVAAAQAVVVQREGDLDAVRKRLARIEALARSNSVPLQELDDNRAHEHSAAAALAAAQAQLAAAQAAVAAAEAQVIGAVANVEASEATVARVAADVQDSQIQSPRDGRVQYRVAQPGEVLGPGGIVLNMVDLSDVYMTFFLPETVAGQVALGSEVHVVLDAAPSYVIPAKVSFVASVAQFTPKTVETASERQKLMFRVKARIDEDLLKHHLEQVKTGLPGIAWLKLDPRAAWPDSLAVKVPQ